MIHETAVIDKAAEIGENVSVGPFTYIQDGVRVGDGCVIGPNVTLLRYTELEENCCVHAGAVLGDLPQDLAFVEAVSRVRIGAGTTIREGVTVQRGTKENTSTQTGRNCYLMAYSHCAHNVRLGNNVILANNVMLGGYVQIGDNVFMGGGSGVHQFVKVGRLAMIGGNSGIGKDLPPFCMIKSQSFNAVSGLNVVGMRRAGLSPEERREVKSAFNILYRSGLNVTQAVAELEGMKLSGPAGEFLEFIKTSERGLCALDRKVRSGKAAEGD